MGWLDYTGHKVVPVGSVGECATVHSLPNLSVVLETFAQNLTTRKFLLNFCQIFQVFPSVTSRGDQKFPFAVAVWLALLGPTVLGGCAGDEIDFRLAWANVDEALDRGSP